MPKYKYTGDYPVNIPELGLVDVQPGQTVEVAEKINHGNFELVKEAAKSAKEG